MNNNVNVNSNPNTGKRQQLTFAGPWANSMNSRSNSNAANQFDSHTNNNSNDVSSEYNGVGTNDNRNNNAQYHNNNNNNAELQFPQPVYRSQYSRVPQQQQQQFRMTPSRFYR